MTHTQNSRERHAGSIFHYLYDEHWGITPAPSMLSRKINLSPRRPPTPAPWYRKYARV